MEGSDFHQKADLIDQFTCVICYGQSDWLWTMHFWLWVSMMVLFRRCALFAIYGNPCFRTIQITGLNDL